MLNFMNTKMNDIVQRVAGFYGEQVENITGKRRYEPLVTVRGVAMVLATEAGLSPLEIAWDLNVGSPHHVTAQAKRVKSRATVDGCLGEDLRRLRAGRAAGRTFKDGWNAMRARYNRNKVRVCRARAKVLPRSLVEWDGEFTREQGRPGFGSLAVLEARLAGV